MENFYLKQFSFFNGEYDITFNILDIDTEKMEIVLAITNAGKIIVQTLDLKLDREHELYFQYGVEQEKIKIDDFEQIEEGENK